MQQLLTIFVIDYNIIWKYIVLCWYSQLEICRRLNCYKPALFVEIRRAKSTYCIFTSLGKHVWEKKKCRLFNCYYILYFYYFITHAVLLLFIPPYFLALTSTNSAGSFFLTSLYQTAFLTLFQINKCSGVFLPDIWPHIFSKMKVRTVQQLFYASYSQFIFNFFFRENENNNVPLVTKKMYRRRIKRMYLGTFMIIPGLWI